MFSINPFLVFTMSIVLGLTLVFILMAIWQRNTDFVTVAFIFGLVTVGLLIACGTSWERIHNPLPPVPLVKHIPTNTPPSVKILFQE
jgi:hypothetical protein